VKVGTHIIMPRVIIVSDFDATIDTQFKGRDADNSEDRIKVGLILLHALCFIWIQSQNRKWLCVKVTLCPSIGRCRVNR
jgi:hypothetical protein